MTKLNKWRLKAAMDKKNLSITKLAAELETSHTTVHKWIKNGFPSYALLDRLATVLNRDWRDLVGEL